MPNSSLVIDMNKIMIIMAMIVLRKRARGEKRIEAQTNSNQTKFCGKVCFQICTTSSSTNSPPFRHPHIPITSKFCCNKSFCHSCLPSSSQSSSSSSYPQTLVLYQIWPQSCFSILNDVWSIVSINIRVIIIIIVIIFIAIIIVIIIFIIDIFVFMKITIFMNCL